jgi:hypothetical protein
MSLPISRQVVHEITTLLAHLDEDGSTLSAGVSTLTPPPSHVPAAGPCPRPATTARSGA